MLRMWWKPAVGMEKWHEVKVAQSCPTLCVSMDCIVHGILQARVLEWVAFPFSRGSSQPRNQTGVSCIAGGFFTSWAIRETPGMERYQLIQEPSQEWSQWISWQAECREGGSGGQRQDGGSIKREGWIQGFLLWTAGCLMMWYAIQRGKGIWK